MTTPNDPNDWLESLLKKQPPYIDDAGFTANVASKLPPPKKRRSRTIVLGGTAALAGLASIVLPVDEVLSGAVSNFLGWTSAGQTLPLTSMVIVALMAWALVGLVRGEET